MPEVKKPKKREEPVVLTEAGRRAFAVASQMLFGARIECCRIGATIEVDEVLYRLELLLEEMSQETRGKRG